MSKLGARNHYGKNDKEARPHAEAVRGALNITWEGFVKIHQEITRICASRDAIIRSLCADQVLAVATGMNGSEPSFDAIVDAVCARSMDTCQVMVNSGILDTNGIYTDGGVDFWAMEFEEARKRDQSSKTNSSRMKRSYAEDSSNGAEPASKRTRLEESKKRDHPEHSSGDDAPSPKRSRLAKSLKRGHDTDTLSDGTRALKRTKIAD